jgi:hypothetical protein
MISKFSFVVTALFLTTIFLVVIACIPNDKIAVFGQVGTSVGGYLSENTNWTVNNSPYIVEETVIVEPDVALSIEAGVEVRFANGTELIVDGSLTASGNAANNIIFTSNATVPKPGDWGAIRFRETSDDPLCTIDWASIRYASTGVYAYGSSPTIKNSRIEYNLNFGIYSDSVFIFIEDLGVPLIENCNITNNGGVPIESDRQGGIYVKFGGIDLQNSLVENNFGYGIISVGSSAQAVVASGITVRNNTGTGINGESTILKSKITENYQSGVNSISSIHYNSIFGNTPYDLTVDSGDQVDASYNWWGTTNETLIQESIHDYYDDYNLGIVTYKPYISSPYFVPLYEQVHEVGIFSNSSVTDFSFSQSSKSISFNVNGTTGTSGFCDIRVPAELMSGDFSLYLDDALLVEGVDYTESINGTHYFFNIVYDHSSHIIELVSTNVIPEFAGWMFLPFLISATLLGFALIKRLKDQRNFT